MGPTPPGKTRDKIYKYVKRRIIEGSSPTVREVRDAFGFKAVQTAREHLEALVKQGRLTKEPGRRSRSYRLPAAVNTIPVMVPLLGQVQAGELTTAEQNPEGYVMVNTRSSGEELFALKVRGESMKGAGILPQDVVIVRRQLRAQHGEIVVALVGEEATVKRLSIRKNKVELHPDNPDFPILSPDPRDVRILGKVIQVRRYLEHRTAEEVLVLP